MKPSKTSLFILFVSAFIIIIHFLVLAINFNTISNVVPTHYSGKSPDSFGSKMMLWLEPTISAILFILISFCIFKMKTPNSLESILENSGEQATKNRQLLLSVLALVVTLLLSVMSFISLL